jgi:teichoic acid transport system ATP-binding protein
MSCDMKIRVAQLGKCYKIYSKPQDRLKQALWRGRRRWCQEFWALKDVSFVVDRGETVGVIGQNGSGKSTLLQLIAGILTPTEGRCGVQGRVAALLELGAGFDPECTGRENVYMNAAVLGLSREEIDACYNDIIAFADIGEFVERPVKMYSSGMYLRLAFAVAVNVEPDILLIDEVLAVGDIRFQAKCLERMREIQRRGTTVLFVSHSMEQVKRFCPRCLWLDGGRLMMDGEAPIVTDRYVASMTAAGNDGQPVGTPPSLDHGVLARIRSVELSEKTLEVFASFQISVEYEVFENNLASLLLGVAFYTMDRRSYIFGPNTALDDIAIPSTVGLHRVIYSIPRLPLLGGTYMVDVGMFLDRGLVCLDYRREAAGFIIQAPYRAEGLVHIEHVWEVCE